MDVDRRRRADNNCGPDLLQWSHVLMDVDSGGLKKALDAERKGFNGATS